MRDPNAPKLINRSMTDEPELAGIAARLLRSAEALAGLSEADARRIVAYMRLIKVSEGQVLTREGEAATNGFMLLVIDGEVTVEGITAGRAEPVVLSVLGPGHLIGETALLDGGPRTATCVATTPLIGAGLSRNALRRLLTADPEVAARLLAAVGRRMAERLRDANRQQRVYHQLLNSMQTEVDLLQRQLHQVMDGRTARLGAPD